VHVVDTVARQPVTAVAVGRAGVWMLVQHYLGETAVCTDPELESGL